MLPQLDKIKGIHPGVILKRELKIQDLKSSELASLIDEHKQTISAIVNKRRDINPKLSIKLAKQFNVDEAYFMILQACYDVKINTKTELKKTPNLSIIRKVLFWDTDINIIDWEKNSKSVVKRILERGNDLEINEIISFYGRARIIDEIKKIKNSILPSFNLNIQKYNLV